jgi:hypothetical protein
LAVPEHLDTAVDIMVEWLVCDQWALSRYGFRRIHLVVRLLCLNLLLSECQVHLLKSQ